AARAGALEEGEGAAVRVEHHLLGLARISPHEQHPAVAQPDMRDLHGHRRAVDQHDLVRPVELVGLARRKTQRYIRLCHPRAVLRDTFSARTISLIDLPRTKCSRLIRPIVSTTSIPRHPLASPSGSACTSLRKGGQSWTPITPLPGSIFHAETQSTHD